MQARPCRRHVCCFDFVMFLLMLNKANASCGSSTRQTVANLCSAFVVIIAIIFANPLSISHHAAYRVRGHQRAGALDPLPPWGSCILGAGRRPSTAGACRPWVTPVVTAGGELLAHSCGSGGVGHSFIVWVHASSLCGGFVLPLQSTLMSGWMIKKGKVSGRKETPVCLCAGAFTTEIHPTTRL